MIPALMLSACSVAVDVDQYRFVESICPHTGACRGGEELWYITVDSDIAREDMGMIAGFDLDYTDEPVCSHPDLISPNGDPGIDNRLAPLVAFLEMSEMFDLHEVFLAGMLAGELLAVAELTNVDDLENDDCVGLVLREGWLPEGIEDPPAYLDVDGDGVLDDGLVLDYGLSTATDERACIINGVLHAQTGDNRIALPISGMPAEFTASLGRVRARVSDSSLVEGWQGGAFEVDELVDLLGDTDPTGLIEGVLRREADLALEGGVCTRISIGTVFESKRFTPGVLRTAE